MLLLFVPIISVDLVRLLGISGIRFVQGLVSVDLPLMQGAVLLTREMKLSTFVRRFSSRFTSKYVRSTAFCRVWVNDAE